MSKHTYVTRDGVRDTMAGWARRLGLSRETLRRRAADHRITPEEAVAMGGPQKRGPKSRLVTIEGITKTRAEWLRLLGGA